MQYDLKVSKNKEGLVYFYVYEKGTDTLKCVFNVDTVDGSIECADGTTEVTGISILGELA